MMNIMLMMVSWYFEEYHDRYQRFANSTDRNSFMKDYYFKIRPSHRLIVTSEDYYNKLPLNAKMRVAFVKKNNKKVLLRKEVTIFVARSELRGKLSILRYC